MNDSINKLLEQIAGFRDKRNWKQFHNPKDLAISISLEAAELLEVFQWTGADTEADSDKKIAKIKEELADVLIYSLLMGHDLGLDIGEIIREKLAQNNIKYPAEKVFGKAEKYTAYQEESNE